jgi:hypothetical protein
VLSEIDTSWQYVSVGVVMIGAVLTNELLRGKGFSQVRTAAGRLSGRQGQRGQVGATDDIEPEATTDLGEEEKETHDTFGIHTETA